MRKLVFGTEQKDKDNFQALYTGFLMGTPEGGLKGMGATRSAMKIMDKFEGAAKPESEHEGGRRPQFANGESLYELNDEGATIMLEQAEYEMLKRHVDNCPWTPSGVRKAVSAMDFLDSAPEE